MTARSLRQRVRLERAGALAAGVQTLADYLRPGVTSEPYICARAHETGRLHATQHAAITAGQRAVCRVRIGRDRCGFELVRWPLRVMLHTAARQLVPDVAPGGLERIRTRTNGAPGQGGAANDDQLREPTS